MNIDHFIFHTAIGENLYNFEIEGIEDVIKMCNDWSWKDITIKSICKIHKVLMFYHNHNPGVFYINRISSWRGNIKYFKNYTEILESLEELLFELRKEMLKGTSLIKISALFLKKFLYIHPFENGNGRLARVLVSIILKPISKYPCPIISDRQKYLLSLLDSSQKNLETIIENSIV